MAVNGQVELDAQKAYVAKLLNSVSNELGDELVKLIYAAMFVQTEGGQTPLVPSEIKK
jgi:hypothetical protein